MVLSLRGQIAVEFIMLYSIILVVFIIIFAVFSSQRAVVLNTQQYSSLQLQAQEISSYINYALSAGNGYSVSLPLYSGSAPLNYNLSISSYGTVVLTSNTAGEHLSTYAPSSARNLVIDGLLLSSSNGISLYEIPTYSGVLHISNFGGTIYIDSTPVSNFGLAGSLEPKGIEENYVPNFNGANSLITIPSTFQLSLRGTPSYTIIMWVRSNTTSQTLQEEIVGKGSSGSNGYDIGLGTLGGCSPNSIAIIKEGAGTMCGHYPSGYAWHQVAVVFGNAGTYLFIDGNLTSTFSNTDPIRSSRGSPLTIGTGPSGLPFDGQISNLQIYNTTLTTNQIISSYSAGIFGMPVLQRNITGWWPLTGNANDYGGGNLDGQYSNITFSSAAELDMYALPVDGAHISGIPVGFIGNPTFPNSTFVLSNSGVASAILTYNSVGPIASAYLFNGNISTSNELAAWWPLTAGDASGNAVYDASGNNNDGIASNVLWAYKSNQVSFISSRFFNNPTNSSNKNLQGVIHVNSSYYPLNLTYNSNITAIVWAYWFGNPPNHCEGLFGDGGFIGSGFQIMGYTNGGKCGAAYLNGAPLGVSGNILGADNWTMLALVGNGGTGNVTIYSDGSPIAYAPPSGYSVFPLGSYYFIGAATENGLDTFNGLISNVQLYKAPLTQTELAQLYSEGPTSLPIPNSKLIGWWPLTGNANDYSGYGDNGAITYNVAFQSQDYALTPDSNQSQELATFHLSNVVVAPAASTSFIGPFTVSLWFSSYYPSNYSFASTLLTTTPLPGTLIQLCGSTACGKSGIHGSFGSGSGYLSDSVDYNFSFTQRRWYLLTEEFGHNQWSIFLNGENVSSKTYASGASGPNFAPMGDNIIIGNGASGSGQSFNGQIADVQVYNGLLSPTQVMQLYEQGLPDQYSVRLSIG